LSRRWRGVLVPDRDGVENGVGHCARSKHHRRDDQEHYAGIDVSLESASVCVVDGSGRIVREAKLASEPDALIAWFVALDMPLARIGLEAGPLSQWLYAAMAEAGLAVELLETRHVRDAFRAIPVKTDRNDARGIAQLMRLGWFRPVHCKSLAAQEVRALLTARKLLQGKLHDVERSLRGILRGFGLKVGKTTPRTFEGRIGELVDGQPTLAIIANALLSARAALAHELRRLEKTVRLTARSCKRTRLLMTPPGVGAIVGLTFVAAIDDPGRFRSLKQVGAHFGLTPRKYQSGETDCRPPCCRPHDGRKEKGQPRPGGRGRSRHWRCPRHGIPPGGSHPGGTGARRAHRYAYRTALRPHRERVSNQRKGGRAGRQARPRRRRQCRADHRRSGYQGRTGAGRSLPHPSVTGG
jgi:transposase